MSFYHNLPYSSQTPKGDFYTFYTIKDIIENGNANRENTFRCRTIGTLENVQGKFLLSDISPGQSEKEYLLMSVCYLKMKLPSTIIPCCVQVFGTVEWKEQPVLYARILQELPARIATIAHSTMVQTVTNHLAKPECDATMENIDDTVIYDIAT